MSGHDTVERAGQRMRIQVHALELYVPQTEDLGLPLRFNHADRRAIQTDDTRLRIPASVIRREDARAAAEIENREGLREPVGNEPSDDPIVIIALTVQDRQDVGPSGQIIKRGVILGRSAPFLLDMRMQGRNVSVRQGLPLPLKIGLVAGESPQPPLVEVGV